MDSSKTVSQWEKIHLDVGQASATLVSDGNRTYLVDADRSQHADKIKSEIDGQTIDGAFITHGHNDHVNGIEKLMEFDEIKIKELYGPHPDLYAEDSAIQLKSLYAEAERMGRE